VRALRGSSTETRVRFALAGLLAFLGWLLPVAMARAETSSTIVPENVGTQTVSLDSGFRGNKDEGVLRFEQAEFVVSDTVTPPKDGWRPQRLPDSWLHNHPGLSGIGWYRVRFNLNAVPRRPMALFVGRVSTTGQIWLNGLTLNPDVRFTSPGTRVGTYMFRWPYLITLPTGLLRAGNNVLHIRLQGTVQGGVGLWDVRIGPTEQLRAPWLVREIPQRIIPQALFALMTAGSIFALLVWLRNRRMESLRFSIAMILWTIIVGLWVLPEPPLSREDMPAFFAALYITFYWILLDLFYRYSECDWHWYPKLLNLGFGFALVCAVIKPVFFADMPQLLEPMAVVLSLTVFLRLLATVMLVQAAWRKHSPKIYALAGAEVLWFSGHVQDIAIFAGWLPPVPFRLDPASSLPLYFVLMYFFVERLVRDREQALRERQDAVDRERARILQDMHDGMGSHLLTALSLAKREDADRVLIARGIEEAMQDLRLIIDSLDSADQGLVRRLAELRYRLQPRLEQLGIQLNWEVDPSVGEFERLTPESVLNVLRIVQEALNNAVKHAEPTLITVSISRQDERAVVEVADNGAGFDPEAAAGRGRGLSGMRKRAEQLGATFHIDRRAGGGTLISLQLPASET